ncbi:QRFP-like peptide receptor, partial [Lamellibrachia satsuma]
NWVYGVVMCKLTPFVEGVSVSVSVLTLLVISIDRLYAILRPMQARLLLSGRRVAVILPVVWLVSVFISSPVIVVNDTAVQPVTHVVYVTTCEEKWRHIDWKNTYNVSMFVMLYVVPLLTMTAAYVTIARVLWRGNDIMHDRGRPEQYTSRLVRSRRRSVRLLMSVIATFAVSWMPYHVVNIYLDLNRDSPRSAYIAMHVYPLVQWLGLANSASNPLCYCFFSHSFYNAFVKMCCYCRR